MAATATCPVQAAHYPDDSYMVSQMAEPSVVQPPLDPVLDRGKQTLLVVDDEEGPRQSIRIVFKDQYNILMANNGPTALKLAREHPIDAAVLDIRMSGMSGIEVLNGLKSIDPTIEVVMLTAYETLETARQALRLGACDYLNKPFDIATLREAVRVAMERRSVSQQIRNSNLRLGELQQELQNHRMREELARTRGEIYASIIHDINGPLTIISGFIEMINQRIGGATHLEGEKLDAIRDRLTRVTRQVTNCVQISSRYLSFLRNPGGQSSKVSVNQVLTDLSELLRHHTNAQQARLSIQPLPEDMDIQINGTDLIQVLLNLAINALQSSERPHQVEVLSERLSEPLPLDRCMDGPQDLFVNRADFANVPPLLAITIRDDGPGIAPELIGKIFEPYFSTKPAGQGTGLGLPIVKRLIEQAHGLVHLHTVAGEGSAFKIYLPGCAA
jgi:two-component system, sensor histidine kinase and response regulator